MNTITSIIFLFIIGSICFYAGRKQKEEYIILIINTVARKCRENAKHSHNALGFEHKAEVLEHIIEIITEKEK